MLRKSPDLPRQHQRHPGARLSLLAATANAVNAHAGMAPQFDHRVVLIITGWARAHPPSFVALTFAGWHLLATNGDDLRRAIGLLNGLL